MHRREREGREKGEGNEEKAQKRERRAEEEFTHLRVREREEKNIRESWKRKKKIKKKILLFLTNGCARRGGKLCLTQRIRIYVARERYVEGKERKKE